MYVTRDTKREETMKFSYANVMSTIAMFAAVTTGTGYAAAQLGANSVRTTHIKNGQVTLSDLHPSVRKKLTNAAASKPTGTVGVPTRWTDRGVLTPGAQLLGFDQTVPALPNAGRPGGKGMKWRLTGTITNNGPDVIDRPHLSVYFGQSSTVSENANYRYLQCMLDDQTGGGIKPGQTLTIEPKWCPDMNRATADRYMRVTVNAGRSSASSSLISNLKLEYAAG